MGTVSWNAFSIKWALIWVIAELCTVFQTRVITKTKQSGKSHEFCGGRPCFSYCSWPPAEQKSRLLIGLNCILHCLNNSIQIAKYSLFAQEWPKFHNFGIMHCNKIKFHTQLATIANLDCIPFDNFWEKEEVE